MRKFFSEKKDFMVVQNLKNAKPSMRSTSLNESMADELKIELNNDYHFVNKESDLLCSYLILSNSIRSHSRGLYNFLTRIGLKQTDFPECFLKIVEDYRLKEEESKKDFPLCPYIKSFGSCLNVGPNSCKYRHQPNKRADELAVLNNGMTIPKEGFVRFKISFMLDTNRLYINRGSCYNIL